MKGTLISRVKRIENKLDESQPKQKIVVTKLQPGENPPKIKDENVLHIVVSKN